MVTHCSRCGRELDELKSVGKSVVCTKCGVFTAVGANSNLKGGKRKMGDKIEKVKKVLVCSVCKTEKSGRSKKGDKPYICRDCRRKRLEEKKAK